MSPIVSAEGRIAIRPWARGDEIALQRHADNRKIWINLRDRFPHPYTAEDARFWIEHCLANQPTVNFAIDLGGEAIGAVGLVPGTDVHRVSAEVGYWLSEAHWGKGIAAEALRTLVGYISSRLEITRLFAGVFEWNPASTRVLEKAGFEFEGRRRRSAVKDGRIVDELYYSRVIK